MVKIMRLALVATFVVATAMALGGDAQANHSWNGYHWARTANPFTLHAGDNVSASWTANLNTAAGDWSQSTVLNLPVETGLTSGKKCRPTSGTVQVCSAAYGRNGWLGLAQIWLSSGHIVQGLAKVNDTYFVMAQYNNPNEKQHVMCQEIGHTLGLGHTSEDGSSQGTCMDYSTSSTSTHPNAHDYAELETIYSHTDSYNSYATTYPTSARGQAAAARGFAGDGTPVGATPAGGNVYVTDLGGGRRIVTFINWAD